MKMTDRTKLETKDKFHAFANERIFGYVLSKPEAVFMSEVSTSAIPPQSAGGCSGGADAVNAVLVVTSYPVSISVTSAVHDDGVVR